MQHIYISYPPNDYQFAHRLVDDLQAAGYLVFVDAVSEVGSLQWAAETRRAIRGSGAVIMILSPEEGRRTGIRHEGVLAKRRQKPLFVVLRSQGDLPRYLTDAVMIDFSGEYDPARDLLLSRLPLPLVLRSTETSGPPRRPKRPPHPPDRVARRRARQMMVLALVVLVCVVLGIVLGVIPL